MKNNMQQMTIDDLNGRWKTKNGNCHIWICNDKKSVQLFENKKLIIDETLDWGYLPQENMLAISKSVTLFMLFPEDNSIILKCGDEKIEFVR